MSCVSQGNVSKIILSYCCSYPATLGGSSDLVKTFCGFVLLGGNNRILPEGILRLFKHLMLGVRESTYPLYILNMYFAYLCSI